MGLAWFLSSLSVYFRDIGQLTGLLSTILLFLSPIFYPVSRIPENYQPFIYANPLTFIIEQARAVMLQGVLPDWIGLSISLAASLLAAWLGFSWFQKTRSGFADVL